jgi:feruloyl-CoA synthase
VSASAGLIADAVICGHDSDRITAMVWLTPVHAGRVDEDGTPEPSLRAELLSTMRATAVGAGSSQRVERVLVLAEPPLLDAGEITDKGYVNQRAVRERRAAQVAALAAEPAPPHVVCLA